jgi:hypothetical protein
MKKELQYIVSVGLLAGMTGGLITGLCARSVIWVFGFCTQTQPGCTPHNILILLGWFVLSGAVLGPLFLWLTRAKSGPVELCSGLYCLPLILTVSLLVRLVQSFNQETRSPGFPALSAILFAVILPILGLSVGLLTNVIEHRLFAESVPN